QRREGWAFVAGLGANLAVSFLAWDAFSSVPLEDWWPRLLQINLACTGLVGLVWLSLARSGFTDKLDPTRTPLLNVQIVLALTGNAALLLTGGILIVSLPDALDPLVGQAGHLWGWVSLALGLSCAGLHVGRAGLSAAGHVAGCLVILLGLQVACTVAVRWPHDWIA